MEQIERAIPRIIERLTTNSILARFNQRLASERKKRQQNEQEHRDQQAQQRQLSNANSRLQAQRWAALKSQHQGRER